MYGGYFVQIFYIEWGDVYVLLWFVDCQFLCFQLLEGFVYGYMVCFEFGGDVVLMQRGVGVNNFCDDVVSQVLGDFCC